MSSIPAVLVCIIFPLEMDKPGRESRLYTIETVLDELPRTYTPELYQTKCNVVYQHVFDSYSGMGGGLYAM